MVPADRQRHGADAVDLAQRHHVDPDRQPPHLQSSRRYESSSAGTTPASFVLVMPSDA
jgi:hypothetical protein